MKSESAMATIDLNCDMGEGAGFDAELMPLISSVNIACGAHAGSPEMMRSTAALALNQGVQIGAHPGFADPAHFGRRELTLEPGELKELVVVQIRALQAIAPVAHVKPHGGLYNLAARDRRTAETVADAVASVDESLLLFALARSELVRAGQARGLRVWEEVFADRRYEPDGSLTSRAVDGAVIADEAESANQVMRMIQSGVVRARDGRDVAIRAQTVCVHGDTRDAVRFAERLRQECQRAGITIRSPRV